MLRVTLRERFDAKWMPEPNTGCWLWTGRCGPYGELSDREGMRGGRHSPRSVRAHRVSYELHVGQIPDGMQVCHRCDTPACVNPDHLFLGTFADNMDDKVVKGRHARGEICRHARLSDADVREILTLGHLPLREIAARYGVSITHVCGIRKGRYWRHLREGLSPKDSSEEEAVA